MPAIITQNEYAAMQQLIRPTADAHLQEQQKKAQLKALSEEKVQHWSDSTINQRRKRHEERMRQAEESEQKLLQIDHEEKLFQEEVKRKANENAQRHLFEDTEEIRELKSAQQLDKVCKQRHTQIEEKQRILELKKIQDQQYFETMKATLQIQEQIEQEKLCERKNAERRALEMQQQQLNEKIKTKQETEKQEHEENLIRKTKYEKEEKEEKAKEDRRRYQKISNLRETLKMNEIQMQITAENRKKEEEKERIAAEKRRLIALEVERKQQQENQKKELKKKLFDESMEKINSQLLSFKHEDQKKENKRIENERIRQEEKFKNDAEKRKQTQQNILEANAKEVQRKKDLALANKQANEELQKKLADGFRESVESEEKEKAKRKEEARKVAEFQLNQMKNKQFQYALDVQQELLQHKKVTAEEEHRANLKQQYYETIQKELTNQDTRSESLRIALKNAQERKTRIKV